MTLRRLLLASTIELSLIYMSTALDGFQSLDKFNLLSLNLHSKRGNNAGRMQKTTHLQFLPVYGLAHRASFNIVTTGRLAKWAFFQP